MRNRLIISGLLGVFFLGACYKNNLKKEYADVQERCQASKVELANCLEDLITTNEGEDSELIKSIELHYEKIVWNEAQRIDTINSYAGYLGRSRIKVYRGEAVTRIKDLRHKSELQRAELVLDLIAREVIDSEVLEAIEKINIKRLKELLTYENVPHRARIERLLRQEDPAVRYNFVVAEDRIEGYEQFVTEFPDSIEADEARIILMEKGVPETFLMGK